MAHVSELSSVLQCGVCFEAFNGCCHRPLSLPCGHTFCATCIQQGRIVHCPDCRRFFGKQKLPTNFAVLRAAVQCAHERSCSPSCGSANCMQPADDPRSADSSHTGAAVPGAAPDATSSNSSSNNSRLGKRARCRRWLSKCLGLTAQTADSSAQAPQAEAAHAEASVSHNENDANGSPRPPTRLELLLQRPPPHQRSRQLQAQARYSSIPPHSIVQQQLQLQLRQQQRRQPLTLVSVWRSFCKYLAALSSGRATGQGLAVIIQTICAWAISHPANAIDCIATMVVITTFIVMPLFGLFIVYGCCAGLLSLLF